MSNVKWERSYYHNMEWIHLTLNPGRRQASLVPAWTACLLRQPLHGHGSAASCAVAGSRPVHKSGCYWQRLLAAAAARVLWLLLSAAAASAKVLPLLLPAAAAAAARVRLRLLLTAVEGPLLLAAAVV